MSFLQPFWRATLIAPFLVIFGSSAVAGSAFQHIGVHDVSFTLPEMNPAWSAVGSCLIAAVLILRHSAKFRK
jgi:hypothetical protein